LLVLIAGFRSKLQIYALSPLKKFCLIDPCICSIIIERPEWKTMLLFFLSLNFLLDLINKKSQMVINLSEKYSLLSDWIGELRDKEIQTDRMRFRRNLERIGEVAACEISKQLEFTEREIETPLGTSICKVLKAQPVIATILRAGLPLHQGLLNYFDKADNAFISAYRKHNKDGSFDISLDYVSCPDLENRVVIIPTRCLLPAPPWLKRFSI
jgi:hypothetical protein